MPTDPSSVVRRVIVGDVIMYCLVPEVNFCLGTGDQGSDAEGRASAQWRSFSARKAVRMYGKIADPAG